MHRFFQPDQTLFSQPTIVLPEAEAHHARRVLRLKEGTLVYVHDGKGHVACGSLQFQDKKGASVHVHQRFSYPEPTVHLSLFQGLSKSHSFEWIVQKATELGVGTIIPVLTQHSVSRPDDHHVHAKLQRWHSIAVSALKQSGQPWLPEVLLPRKFEEALDLLGKTIHTAQSSIAFAAVLTRDARPLRTWLASIPTSVRRLHVALWIGPEGDFTQDEVEQLLRLGCKPVNLGPATLRTETAAIVGIALILYELCWNSGQAGEKSAI